MCECSTHMGQKITAEPSLGISAETVVNQQSLWEVTLQTTAVFSNKLGNFKMEQQQYEPNAAHQVTNIIQAKSDNEKVNLLLNVNLCNHVHVWQEKMSVLLLCNLAVC